MSTFWSAAYLRSVAIFLIIKGIFCLLSCLALEYTYAQSGRISGASPYFFLANLAYPFSIFLGLYFIGANFGSNRSRFLDKLSVANGPIAKAKLAKPASAFLTGRPIPLGRAIILLSLDLALSLGLIFLIPELPHFYLIHILEVICLFLLARDRILTRKA